MKAKKTLISRFGPWGWLDSGALLVVCCIYACIVAQAQSMPRLRLRGASVVTIPFEKKNRFVEYSMNRLDNFPVASTKAIESDNVPFAVQQVQAIDMAPQEFSVSNGLYSKCNALLRQVSPNDNQLSQEEYVVFINELTHDAYNYTSFDDLPSSFTILFFASACSNSSGTECANQFPHISIDPSTTDDSNLLESFCKSAFELTETVTTITFGFIIRYNSTIFTQEKVKSCLAIATETLLYESFGCNANSSSTLQSQRTLQISENTFEPSEKGKLDPSNLKPFHLSRVTEEDPPLEDNFLRYLFLADGMSINTIPTRSPSVSSTAVPTSIPTKSPGLDATAVPSSSATTHGGIHSSNVPIASNAPTDEIIGPNDEDSTCPYKVNATLNSSEEFQECPNPSTTVVNNRCVLVQSTVEVRVPQSVEPDSATLKSEITNSLRDAINSNEFETYFPADCRYSR